MEEREKEFAKKMFGVENLETVNMTNNANWRNMLEAIDYAIESKE